MKKEINNTWRKSIDLILSGKKNESFEIICLLEDSKGKLEIEIFKQIIIKTYGSGFETGNLKTILWLSFEYFAEKILSDNFNYRNEKATSSFFKTSCIYKTWEYKKQLVSYTKQLNVYTKKLSAIGISDNEFSYIERDRLMKIIVTVFRQLKEHDYKKFIFLVKIYNGIKSKRIDKLNNDKLYELLSPFYNFKKNSINKFNQIFKQKLFDEVKFKFDK